MEALYQELFKKINSGATISISQYLREFERLSYSSPATKESLIFHLFACYITGQYSHARLLWKRIPQSLKTPGELEKTWELGRCLYKKEMAKALRLINSAPWVLAADVVKILKNKLVEDVKIMVAKAYISIEIKKLADMLGIHDPEVAELVERWGWTVENGFVMPIYKEREFVREVEDRDIEQITQVVGFLEQKYHIGIDN